MPEAVPNPHDRLIKWVLSRPAAAGVVLRHVLPTELCARLDWSSISVPASVTVDPNLDEHLGDLLCAIDLHGPPPRSRLYVPIEHQTNPDRALPRRFTQTIASLWHRLERDDPRTRNAPPFVVPVVLYPGPRPWNHPTHLSGILDGADQLRDVFSSPIELAFLLDDLTGSVLSDPLGSKGVVSLVQSTRDLLRWSRRPSEVTRDDVIGLASLLHSVLDELGPADIRALWTYVVTAFPDDHPLETLLLRIARPSMRQHFTTTYDRLIAKGRSEGIAKGRSEGIAKGKAEALLQLIDLRGLSLSEPARRRIETCIDEDRLHRWLDRVLRISTEDELLEA